MAFRAGWQWVAVEGTAEIIGPDDPHPDVDADRLRSVLRDVFSAAGGTHDDWDEYDRVMERERPRRGLRDTDPRLQQRGSVTVRARRRGTTRS